jgi:sugar phosphate permease
MTRQERDLTHYDIARAALSRWRKQTITLLWVAYAAFYLCRVNLAAAQSDLAAAEGLSKRQLGILLSLLKAVYTVGQLANGILSDRLGPRRLLLTGLFASAGLNAIFSHLSDFRYMALVWAANGYFQACGWTPVVRTIANWFPARLRDAASGIIGVSYILGSGVSWLLAGHLTERYGWRYAFWVPPWICVGVVVLLVIAFREHPSDVGLTDEEAEADQTAVSATSPTACAPSSLRDARLWALGCAMLCFNFGYHGLLDWMPHYLAEARGLAAGAASTQAFLLPLGGAIGCTVLTVVTRRKAKARPLAVAALLAALAVLIYAVPYLTERLPRSLWATIPLLGVLSSVPASLMACAMPVNVVAHNKAATAAGIIDSLGYVGSATSGWASGRVLDRVGRARGSAAAWRAAWHIWPIGVVASAAMMVGLAVRGETAGETPTPDLSL